MNEIQKVFFCDFLQLVTVFQNTALHLILLIVLRIRLHYDMARQCKANQKRSVSLKVSKIFGCHFI